MKPLRIFFVVFAACASLVALAHHLGWDLWGCASCSFVDQQPVSAFLAWGGPVVLLALAYALATGKRRAAAALCLAGLGSVALGAWMLVHHTLCPVCMLVHIGVLAAALTLLPGAGRVVAPLFFSLAVAFAATGGWDLLAPEQGVAIFRPRDHEVIPDGRAYVLFTDPECPRCRLVEDRIAALRPPVGILHRWTLLPQDTYRSIRACALLEMARARSPEDFERLRLEIHDAPLPLTDAVLTAATTRAGLGALVENWLDQPDDAALNAITSDQTTSQELKIQSLPALAELAGPDAAGMRTLRLVPFAAIGVRR